MNRTHRSLALGLFAAISTGIAVVGGAQAGDREAEALDEESLEAGSLVVCDHEGKLAAAKEALLAGDRPAAIAHLKAAKALLVECERRAGEAEAESEGRQPASQVI